MESRRLGVDFLVTVRANIGNDVVEVDKNEKLYVIEHGVFVVMATRGLEDRKKMLKTLRLSIIPGGGRGEEIASPCCLLLLLHRNHI